MTTTTLMKNINCFKHLGSEATFGAIVPEIHWYSYSWFSYASTTEEIKNDDNTKPETEQHIMYLPLAMNNQH